MSILNYFIRKKPKTAIVAKERLQIIFAREHARSDSPDYLPELKRDLLDVISKYTNISINDVTVNLDREGDCEILELNIVLPELSIKTSYPTGHMAKETESA